MEDHWQLLQEAHSKEQNRMEAQAFVPADSIWFSGHFPEDPILPGIALIYLVWQAIVREAGKRKEKISLESLKKVRFAKLVRPGENLSIIVTESQSAEQTLYSFKVIARETVVCTGLIVAKSKDK
jgi:3-hydroxymyristoyl/3-hydroxydecanoyl-(acyl carrier protein) dehydratase